MNTHPIDDLFFSVNDIYTQYDESDIDYNEAEQILLRVCFHFIKQAEEKQNASTK